MLQPEKLSSRRRDLVFTAAFSVALITFVIFLRYSLPVILLLFVGVLLAIPLSAFCTMIQNRTRLSRPIAMLISVTVIVLVLYGIGALIAPQFGEQLTEMSQQLPQAMTSLETQLRQSELGASLLQAFNTGEGLVDFRQDPQGVVSRATGVVSGALNALFMIVVVVFAGIYLAVNPELYLRGLLRLLPLNHRKHGAEILAAIGYTLKRWMFGQFLSMSSVGIMTTLGLYLLDVPLALGLGMLAFALDFVPTFGPIIAAVPAVLLTLAEDPTKALYVVILYIVVQQTEGLLITPLLQQRAVYLPPVLTITSQVLLALLAGPIGLLLATPLTAVLLVLVQTLYVNETLGDPIHTPLEKIAAKDKSRLPHQAGHAA